MDGSQCVIRVDGAPGFKSLVNDKVLKSHNMRVEIGRAKNVNRNPVAEHCIQELESEITRIEPKWWTNNSCAAICGHNSP